MTEQTEEKPTGAGPEKAGVAESVGEAESSAPETTVPDETDQSAPAKPVGGAEQDHQPPVSETALRSEPTPAPAAAAPASESVPAPEPKPAHVPEAAAVLGSEPAPVPAAAQAAGSLLAAASASAPASAPQAVPAPEPKPVPVPESAAVLRSEPAPVPAAAQAAGSLLPPAPEPAHAPEAPHVPGTAATPDPTHTPAPTPDPTHTPAPTPDPTLTPDLTLTPAPAPKTRRGLRATLRWTAALLTFAAFGAGSAYGIAGMERTDVPGLGTVSDGRWVYPVLTKAPLPSGSPGPLAKENKAGSHYADLRALVLPAPEGATVDKALGGTDGWLPTKDLLSEYSEKEDRDELGTKLSEDGLRHIAARGWTTPDGTHTRIYLLQFDTAAVVDDLFGEDIAPYGSPGYELRDAPDSRSDEAFPDAARIPDITASVYVESKPYGKEQARHAYLGVGDVIALVVQSRKGTANPVPFQQTVTLQSQLLG